MGQERIDDELVDERLVDERLVDEQVKWVAQKGEDYFISILDEGRMINTINNADQLLTFAVEAALSTGATKLIQHILQKKFRYSGDKIRVESCDKKAQEIMGVSTLKQLRHFQFLTVNALMEHSRGPVKKCDGSFTIPQLCELTKDRKWKTNFELALIQRLQNGACLPTCVSLISSLVHFSINMALLTGSHALLQYTLESRKTNLSEKNEDNRTPLQAIAWDAQDCGDLDDKLAIQYKTANLIIHQESSHLSITHYEEVTEVVPESNPVRTYILQRLPVSELTKLKVYSWTPDSHDTNRENTWSWGPGCEDELIRRLKNGEVCRQDLKFNNSFLHFIIDQTVKSDSQKLLLYVLENEYVTKEDMNELDCDGRTIIQTVVNTKHIRCTNRTNCLLTLATHDHVDVYMKNNDGVVGLNDTILKEEGKKNGNMRSFYNRLRFFLEHTKPVTAEQVREELQKRLELANKHVSDKGEKSHVGYIHRTKEPHYWTDVLHIRNCKIPRTPKRDYGSRKDYKWEQHGCPLNEIMRGIFFVVNDEHDMGFRKIASPFGTMRLYKPVKDIAPTQGLNYYFADFYCISLGKMHYVLIGVAKEGTWEDCFCKNYLVKIDIKNNRFFTIRDDGTAECCNKVWVYIFYMDDMEVSRDIYNRVTDQSRMEERRRENKEYFAKVHKLLKNKIGGYVNEEGEGLPGRVKPPKHDVSECPICHIGRRPPRQGNVRDDVRNMVNNYNNGLQNQQNYGGNQNRNQNWNWNQNRNQNQIWNQYRDYGNQNNYGTPQAYRGPLMPSPGNAFNPVNPMRFEYDGDFPAFSFNFQ